MRRPTMLRLAVTAALLVTIAACGTTEPRPSPTPSAPSASSQGPGDSPAGGARSALSEFEGHLREVTATEGELVRAIGAASSGGAAEVRLVVGRMRAWADGEARWVAENPASPCYAAAVEKLRDAADAMTAAATGFEAYVTVSVTPSDDVTAPSMAAEAAAHLGEVEHALTDAAALAKAARTACS